LKEALNRSFLQGDEVTNIASEIKLKLDNLLNFLKVKSINHEPKTKESQFLKIRWETKQKVNNFSVFFLYDKNKWI